MPAASVGNGDPDAVGLRHVDRDAVTGEESQPAAQVLDNELVRSIPAWQKGQVVYLDSVAWYLVNGGLPTLQSMTEEVASALGAK